MRRSKHYFKTIGTLYNDGFKGSKQLILPLILQVIQPLTNLKIQTKYKFSFNVTVF